ncbi:MAG: hypothetical protein AAGF11_56395 [Myxococcota bacterium]
MNKRFQPNTDSCSYEKPNRAGKNETPARNGKHAKPDRNGKNKKRTRTEDNKPAENPHLAAPLYAIAHFDPSQSDSTPNGPTPGTAEPIEANLASRDICYAGPVNIMTLASIDSNYMWQVGTDKVSYLRRDTWSPPTAGLQVEALHDATQGNADSDSYDIIPTDNFIQFANMVAENEPSDGQTPANKMKGDLEDLFGPNYAGRFNHGLYAVVSNDNVLYVKYGDDIVGYTVNHPTTPTEIIEHGRLTNAVSTINGGSSELEGLIVGLSMTYDGKLIVIIKNGIGIVDPDLETVLYFHKLDDGEHSEYDETISNSICVDEDHGIYVASTLSVGNTGPTIGYMRKLVWIPDPDPTINEGRISDNEGDGAWREEYETSSTDPPMIKEGRGTGSTPTLMGFGDDPDKLVVITDGAQKMKLLAFWRDDIPQGSTDRLADEISVTCGLDDPDWIQSEQSVVVSGYGAFVVNNIPAQEDAHDELKGADKILQVSLVGPAYTGPRGAERFQWDTNSQTWRSVWTNSEVSATSMVPIHSQKAGMEAMVIVGGYNNDDDAKEWQLVGLSWEGHPGPNGESGWTEVVYRVSLGKTNRGNGAYSIPQYLDDDTLVFNSIVGPILVDLS